MKNLFKAFLAVFCISCATPSNAQVPDKAEDISPLLIGETLPKATLQYADGTTTELQTILKEKPTVLVFYRGGWCPYCNMQLSGLVHIEKEVLELGYQIVAISPDDYQNLKNTEEKDSISYTLLSDKNGQLIQEIGIGFKTPIKSKAYISAKGQKGETSDVIPVPTLMVVDQEGNILFEYINPSYKTRISSEMILAVLGSLKK